MRISYTTYRTSIVLLLLGLILSGCLGTRYLEKDEHLLYQQQIKGNKNVSTESLEAQYQQRPNIRTPLFPFAPYVWFYRYGSKLYDTAELREQRTEITARYNERIKEAQKEDKARKEARLLRKKNKKLAKLDRTLDEGNLLMRWGEPLSILDSSKLDRTKELMDLHLSSRGHFNGSVSYKVKIKGIRKNLSRVTYTVEEGTPWRIDTLFYKTGDPRISRLLRENEKESEIVVGEIYNEDKLETERERINTLMQNNGYFDFSKLYIQVNIDTTWSQYGTAVQIEILKPETTNKKHKVYRVDSIVFVTDAQVRSQANQRQFYEEEGITYGAYEHDYSPKILRQRVFINQGEVYSKRATFDTQRQLANLDNFKFINVNYDTTGGKMIANIFTSPLKKYQTTTEVGVNVNINAALPGPFVSTSFKNRNVFGGLETLELGLSAALEGTPAFEQDDLPYRSQELTANLSLTFPQFILPLSYKAKRKLGEINPRTIFSAGFSYNNRREYVRSNFTTNMQYRWQTRKGHLYTLTLTDLDFIDSRISRQSFLERLQTLEQQGNNLIDSFEPSIVSSMGITATYNYNSYGAKTQSSFWRISLESGGTTLNLIGEEFFRSDSLETYRYLRVTSDYRKNIPIDKKTSLAYRVNFGTAWSYGDNKTLPYEKFFFAGGSNSIRAWRPRRLGPGSYNPGENEDVAEDGLIDYSIEQQGSLLIESSVELRRNIIGFIEGALFIDAGNIWTLRRDPSRPGSQFNPGSLIEEIAVGTGVGFRFDFSFLVLRLDVGIKVWDPARDGAERFVLDNFSFSKPYSATREPVVFNIGVGYPF